MTARTHDRAKLGTVEFLAARYGVPVREGEHADYYRGSGDVDDIVDWPDR